MSLNCRFDWSRATVSCKGAESDLDRKPTWVLNCSDELNELKSLFLML